MFAFLQRPRAALSYKMGRDFSVTSMAALMVLFLVGCGSSDEPGTTDDQGGMTERSVQLVPTTDASALEAFIKGGLEHASGMTDAAWRGNNDSAVGMPVADEPSLDATRPSVIENSEAPLNAVDGLADDSVAASPTFSTTNLQEVGVDESDLVKYDGDFLYIADNTALYYNSILPMPEPSPPVIQTASQAVGRSSPLIYPYEPPVRLPSRIIVAKTSMAPARSETISTITLESHLNITGLYLFKQSDSPNADRLVVLGNKQARCDDWLDHWCWAQGNTTLLLYDVATPETPTLLSQFETNAHTLASRRVGDQLYLATRFTPNLPGFDAWVTNEEELVNNQAVLANASLTDLLPLAQQDLASAPLVAPENCFITPEMENDSRPIAYQQPSVFGVTQLSLESLTQTASVCAVGSANGLYASADRLFLYASHWDETHAHGFALKEAGPVYLGSGSVSGAIGWRNTNFRFSAAGDYLRVITSQGSDHRLTILKHNSNANLYEVAATLPNEIRPAAIGKPNEDIYSVRFMQNRAYVVTFQRTDPLYVINLNNPEDPFIEGELEMPGFSDYLHPINDYLLLGIGHAATDIGRQQGVKVALFDVTNPRAPTIISEGEIGDAGTRTPVSGDHRAFAWLPNRTTGQHRFAFPVRKRVIASEADFRSEYSTVLSLWEIDDGITTAALTLRGELESPAQSFGYGQLLRGFINKDAVHFVVDETIVSADWQNADGVSVNENPAVE